jgi:hypothetical protein
MRRALVLFLGVLPFAQAQDPKGRAAALAQARRDLQAQLEVADMLLERGDAEAAELAYRKAMERFAAALGGGAEQARPMPKPAQVPKLEPEDPALRAEEAKRLPPVWVGRGAKVARNLRAGGGSGLTENAVAAGLEWLAKHQDEDGRWDCEGFMKHDPVRDRCDGPGDPRFDVGVTGLALLAFLGAGHTDDGGPYADNVRRALHFLVSSRAEDGWIAGPDPSSAIYEHAIAATALSEAYGMTRSPRARDAAQRAVNLLQRARNPNAGWRYASNGENDTSVTAWGTLALHAARTAGLTVDPEAFKGARAWVENATDPNFGQVGYVTRGGPVARLERHRDRFPPEKSCSMTAAGIFVRIVAGEDPRVSEAIRRGGDLCCDRYGVPTWNPETGSIDMYYWYWGSLAFFQVGGVHWRKWNEAMVEAVARHQQPAGSGSRTGSWDPLDPWGPDGGRVYSTAMLTMCMEVYYRYDRVFGVK